MKIAPRLKVRIIEWTLSLMKFGGNLLHTSQDY